MNQAHMRVSTGDMPRSAERVASESRYAAACHWAVAKIGGEARVKAAVRPRVDGRYAKISGARRERKPLCGRVSTGDMPRSAERGASKSGRARRE